MTIRTSNTKSRFKTIFRDSSGLRTGWSVLLFLTIVAAMIAVIGYVAFILHHPVFSAVPLAMTSGRLILTEATMAFAVLVATFVMGRIEHRSLLCYGWSGPHRTALLVQGLLAGIVLMSLLVGVLVITHGAIVTYSAGGWRLLIPGMEWALGFALVALFEESMFRGYLFFRLADRSGPYLSAIIMSLVFAVAHMGNHGEDILGILHVVVFGLVLCLAVWHTGSLWWALGFHAAWDWSESFLFGASDSGFTMQGHVLTTHAAGPIWLSGGSAGPEGSLLVLPLLALMAIWLMFAVSGKASRNTGR